MRCDVIAEGIIKATKELQLSIPLIVRLQGTKEAEAKAYVSRFLFDDYVNTSPDLRKVELILHLCAQLKNDQRVRLEDLSLR